MGDRAGMFLPYSLLKLPSISINC